MLRSHFKGLYRVPLWRLGYLIGATDVICSRSTLRGGRRESVTDGPVRRAHTFLARKDRLWSYTLNDSWHKLGSSEEPLLYTYYIFISTTINNFNKIRVIFI